MDLLRVGNGGRRVGSVGRSRGTEKQRGSESPPGGRTEAARAEASLQWVTARVPPDLVREIDGHAKRLGTTRSEAIRDCLAVGMQAIRTGYGVPGRGAEEQGLGVGMAVGPLARGRSLPRLEVVMSVARIRRRPAPQEVLEVLEQERLVLVHQYGGGGVPALHRNHPLAHPPKAHEVPADPNGGSLLHADEQARSHSALLGLAQDLRWGERSEGDVTGR